ncbi:MAG TPA: putative Ig domain-containing protein [Terriglobales bacterium]
MILFDRFRSAGLLIVTLFVATLASPQQKSSHNNPDGMGTISLPEAVEGARYQYQLLAKTGSRPGTWIREHGTLPKGLKLSPLGLLDGIPGETGEFHFAVSTSTAGQVAENRRQLTLVVVAPLFARWEHYPKINGQRIEGSIKVSNPTANDFDLTFITVAVNEIGRAEALGYQRFNLRKNTTDFQLPFGENVPVGSYQVHVDVVAEVAATHSIYRQHLETKEKLVLQQGP